MGDAAFERAREVFEGALTRAPEARGSYLDVECGGDLGLRREVESLLASHAEAGGFLSGAPSADTGGGEAAGEPAPRTRPIGPYRILGVIARGGMGTVYRAVRDDDTFQKTVALKLVRAGAASEFVERRFRQERQILARLQHPNIATLLDGGATDDGQPYLVMEHVEGRPITKYCDDLGLDTRKRLALFGPVCAAVQYAHQNLVVHRDLKPDNILVTADGTPKLLDFGIAKLLAAGVDPDTAPTATLLPMMTPEYASPEQVKGEPVTTASDVYSLGVLLYELLAGKRPYVVKTDSMEEIVRAVCQTDPPAPSAATKTRALRGDLDTIVMKALRKEPARRYASVQELWEDLRRFLEGRPVRARPDTVRYRTSKFIGRHRGGVTAAALIALALVGGLVATIRQQRIAEQQRARAERRFADVRKLANTMLFGIHDDIRELPGATQARQRLVTTAQEYLDSLSRESADDPSLQRELAASYERLGDVRGAALSANVGDTAGGLESYGKALAIRQALAARPAADPEDPEAVARLELLIGGGLRGLGRLEEAEKTLRAAADHLEAVPSSPAHDLRGRVGRAFSQLAEVQMTLGHDDQAQASIARSTDHGEAFSRDHPGDRQARAQLATVYWAHSELLRRRRDYQGAVARAQRSRQLHEELVRADRLNAGYQRGLLFSLNGEANALRFLGRHTEAVATYQRAVAMAEDMKRRDPRDRFGQTAVLVAEAALGSGLIAAGRAGQAVTPLRSARRHAERILAVDDANGFARNELAMVDSNLAAALLRAGGGSRNRAEGCQAAERSIANYRRLEADGALPADSRDAVVSIRQLVGERCL